MTTFRRYWFRPVRAIATGLALGSSFVFVLLHGSAIVECAAGVAMVAGLLGSARLVLLPPQTPERVEQFMNELCECDHTRRSHAPEIIQQPTCYECDCEWFLAPIVLGPWDQRFSTLRREHQDRILFGDAIALTTIVLLLCAYL